MAKGKFKVQNSKFKISSKEETYNPYKIEIYWQKVWLEEKIYQPDLDTAKKPFYNLMMFPYPSAEGLHVGNVYTFAGIDAYGRFKRMQGFDVFEPIGLDGFGIHSENYAIKVGRTPQEHAKISEKHFYEQLHQIGNGYDWSRTVETYKPDYYKWTQWLFIELFKAGLAYKAKASVNFCPSCKTVLSDEQVLQKTVSKSDVILNSFQDPHQEDTKMLKQVQHDSEQVGVCERCETEVEKRELEQWFFRITDYAERLLKNIKNLDWSEKVKTAQTNWIGKKSGATIRFKIQDLRFKNEQKEIEVFTTRPDTLYGATFLVISPENPIIEEILNQVQDDKKNEIELYRTESAKKSEWERIASSSAKATADKEGKEKTGVFSGIYAVNPVNNEQIPIWIADYVLVGYGTGAIMAVPAHDQRDFEFAKKYDLPIRIVIANPEEIGVKQSQNSQDESYTGEGVIINSGQWNGWKTPESNEKVTKWLEEKQFGKSSVNYHLRDWLISRQRYWGPPIPMVYCEVCAKEGKSWFTTKEVQSSKFKVQSSAWKADGWYPDENLPVLLPDIKDFRPSGSGKGPLVNHPDFYEITCPACGSKAIRETDVSDTFLDSAWYFLRYLATDRDDIPFPGKFQMSNFKCQISNEKKSDIGNLKLEIGNSAQRAAWLPVTSYIGGAEHAVLHLLYSRFITMVLNDLCYIGFEEPFTKFRTNGLIIKSGAKMSKSKGNVVNPDQYILKYGADTLRTYLGFIGPFSQGGDFQNAGIEGIFRFLNRIWKLVVNFIEEQSAEPRGKGTQKDAENSFSIVPRKILHSSASTSMMHKAIKGVTEDVEELRFNTAIAKIMTYYNFLSDEKENSKEEIETLLKLLAPFAPHITEELWLMIHADNKADSRRSRLNRDGSVKIRSSNLWKSIHLALWPTFDPAKIVSDTVTIAVQVNGKLRSTIILQMAKSKGQMEVEQAVKKLPNIQKYLEGKTIRKVIYVPGKIINFVV